MSPKINSDMGNENMSNSSIDLHSFFNPLKQSSIAPLVEEQKYAHNSQKGYGSEARTGANEKEQSTKVYDRQGGLILNEKNDMVEEIKEGQNKHFVEEKLDVSSDEEEKVSIISE